MENESILDINSKSSSEKKGFFGIGKSQQTENQPRNTQTLEELRKIGDSISNIALRVSALETTNNYISQSSPTKTAPAKTPAVKTPEDIIMDGNSEPGSRVLVIPDQKIKITKGKEQAVLDLLDKMGVTWESIQCVKPEEDAEVQPEP